MALFPILLPVLGAITSIAFIGPRLRGISRISDVPFTYQTVRNPLVKAFFLFVPFYLGRLAFFHLVDVHYTPGGLYLYYLLGDFVGVFFIVAGAAFFFNRSLRSRDPLEQYIGYVVFFTVILVLTAVVDTILGDGYWTLYELFVRPMVYVALLVLYPLSIIHADTAKGGGWAVLLIVISPFLGALPAMWSEWLRPWAAVGATIAVVGFAAFGVFWQAFRGDTDQTDT